MRATFVRNARASVLLGMWVHVCWNCAVYKEHWALICFSDICVFTCYFICGYTLTIPPPHAHAPPLLPSGPTSPVSSSSGHKHQGGTPPLDHGRAAATPEIWARQRRLSLSSWSPLPDTETMKPKFFGLIVSVSGLQRNKKEIIIIINRVVLTYAGSQINFPRLNFLKVSSRTARFLYLASFFK